MQSLLFIITNNREAEDAAALIEPKRESVVCAEKNSSAPEKKK